MLFSLLAVIGLGPYYGRTPVERPPSPTTIPLIRPHFVWRTVFYVCAVPDQRPSLKCDHRLGQMEFIFSFANDHFEYSVFPRIAGVASISVPNCGLLRLFIITQHYYVALRHLWSRPNPIVVNFFYVGDATMAFVVIQVLWLWTSRSYYQRQCNMNVLCKMLRKRTV